MILKQLKIVLSVCFSMLFVGVRPVEAGNMDDFLSTNLLAVVAGYQSTRILPSGIKIPVFTETPPKVETDAKEGVGILFYVIAPTNHFGKSFWVHKYEIEGLNKPDGIFSFKYNTEDCRTVSTNDFFMLPSWQSICSWQYPFEHFHISFNDLVKAETTRLNDAIKERTEEIQIRKKRLEGLDLTAAEIQRKSALATIEFLEHRLQYLKADRARLDLESIEENKKWIEEIGRAHE